MQPEISTSMKKIFTLILLFTIFNFSNNAFAFGKPSGSAQRLANSIDLEMYLLRKGSTVNIALFSKGTEIPKELIIERMSTAPLSNYRTAITLTKEQLTELKTNGKLLLEDLYPESRQLDSYYRLVITLNDGAIKTYPGIFLSRASGDEGVTFGDHRHDEAMFATEESKIEYTYEQFNIVFKIERKNSKVLITIGAKQSKLEGEWTVERKSSAPLATFRKTKSIYGEDLEAILNGERVFLDEYPESRKLDSYYRLVIIDKDRNKLELPSLFLPGDSSN